MKYRYKIDTGKSDAKMMKMKRKNGAQMGAKFH